jgi:uncharacterized protein involved in exopolysaccharide biosynthesis
MIQEEVSLRDQFVLLWRAKWSIFAIVLVFAAAAGAVAFMSPKQYEATITLAAANNSPGGGQMGNLGGMASQFGGLAALAGISVGGDSSKSESIAVLQSERLTETYIRQNQLLPVLFHKNWDAGRKAWNIQDPLKIPTLWKANREFDKSIRKVTVNAKTGIVTLTMTWEDPVLAANWANGMVQLTNEFLLEKAIREAEHNIDYLNTSAGKSNVVEERQAIYSILKTEINRAMLARGSNEYAFKILDPAVTPEMASSPRKMLWTLAGAAFGLLAALLWVFARASSAGGKPS